MLKYFPRNFADTAVYVYIAALLTVSVLFMRPMNWQFWLFSSVAVFAFFLYASRCTMGWRFLSEKSFVQRIFRTSVAIRLIYVVVIYFFYVKYTGSYFEIGAADSYTYHLLGTKAAEMISSGEFDFRRQMDAMGFFSRGIEISDTGYPIYLGFVYLLSGNSIVVARLLKAVLSACTVILTYRVAKRNFGDDVARITAIFCMLMPNLIYYCGTHLKETEMLFLAMLFIDRADMLLHKHYVDVWSVVICVFSCLATYFFRAILPIVLTLALITALVTGSIRMGSMSKRLSIVAIILALCGTVFWNAIAEELDLLDFGNLQAQQEQNMQWRAERSGGNSLAKYAGASVFAPLIFTMPFPTLADVPGQEQQQMLSGGYYVKNVLSFFTILALFSLLKTGKWRDSVLPTAFTCGYLVVLVFSNFAQSERFHIPVLPLELMFAAYGVSLFSYRQMKWQKRWMALMFVVALGWNFIKLYGRGLI